MSEAGRGLRGAARGLGATQSQKADPTTDALWRERLRRALTGDHCHGIVIRDGIEDACDKPTTCVIDDEESGPWQACVWHAHRYGSGRMIPLSAIRAVLRTT